MLDCLGCGVELTNGNGWFRDDCLFPPTEEVQEYVPIGWQCPVCLKVYAPLVYGCDDCNNKVDLSADDRTNGA